MEFLKKIKNFIFGDNFIVMVIRQVIIGLIVLNIITKFILMPCIVDGTSMYPTLVEGQYCLSFIVSKNISIDRFDIVVLDIEGNNRLYVKRVIGLPNETITYKDNKLYINGQYYEEAFLQENVVTNDFEVTLGENEYYLLGDNRIASIDSRSFGPVSKDKIVSSHIFVIRPLKDFGLKK